MTGWFTLALTAMIGGAGIKAYILYTVFQKRKEKKGKFRDILTVLEVEQIVGKLDEDEKQFEFSKRIKEAIHQNPHLFEKEMDEMIKQGIRHTPKPTKAYSAYFQDDPMPMAKQKQRELKR